MLWDTFSWHGLGPLIPLEGRVDAAHDIIILNNNLHPIMQNFFLAGIDVFQDGNASVHRAHVVMGWFEEHEDKVTHLPRLSQ